MKYQNTKTGVIFDSECECTGEDWVLLSPLPVKEEDKEKPKPKRTKKDGNSR